MIADAKAIEPRQQQAASEGALTELLLRAFALLLYGWLVSSIGWRWLNEPSRVTLLLLLLIEAYTLGLVLFARRAAQRDISLLAVASTTFAAFSVVMFSYDDTQRVIPEVVGATLQLCGLAWQISSKVTLGRCFGLLPAARGLVTSGPYRVVRHPIYLGYLISHIGFLATNFCWRNAIVLSLLYAAQFARMRREESVLVSSEQGTAYREYCRSVRFRLIPGLI